MSDFEATAENPAGSYLAGKVGPHKESHEPRLNATLFVSAQSGFCDWDGTGGIRDWGMDFNDRLGCCGFAGWDHANVAKLGDATMAGTSFFPTFKNLADAYFAYGIAQGEPGPQPDQGVDNATMLAWGYKLGLIDGYAEVPLDQLDWFAQQFKGVLIGLALDANTAINDFNASPKVPWDTMGTTDGHDVLGIITHVDGSGQLVTWGGLQPYTANFRKTNFTDAWVIFDRNDSFVNWAALEAALTEIHGVVTSPPAAPAQSTDIFSALKDDVRDAIDALEHWVTKLKSHLD